MIKNGWILRFLTLFKHHWIHIMSLIILFYLVSIVSSQYDHKRFISSLSTMFILFFFLLVLMSVLRQGLRWYECLFSFRNHFWYGNEVSKFFSFLLHFYEKKPTSRPYARYIEHALYVIRSTLYTICVYDRNYTSKSRFRHYIHDIVQLHQHLLTKFSLVF